MAILTLQRRARELGRIRIGQVVAGSNGRSRPEKLDRFRLTSASRPLLEKVAELYGGTVSEWTPANGGPTQWEVITEATRLPVLVPPQPVSQYYELWSGGGCQRRCDGERELLGDTPCQCSPDPAERECKPTTRLNVVLRDVEGIGVWRLESHGYYSAVELPEVAEFLARAQGYVAAYLALEERVVKRNNQTRRFMVPTLEVDVTPAQLLSGDGGSSAPTLGAATAVAALPPAVAQDEDSTLAAISAASSRDELTALWNGLKQSGAVVTGRVRAAFQEAAAAAFVEQIKRDAAELRADLEAERTAASPDVNTLWQQILTAAPENWSTQDVELAFSEVTGVDAGKATAADMQRYLDGLSS